MKFNILHLFLRSAVIGSSEPGTKSTHLPRWLFPIFYLFIAISLICDAVSVEAAGVEANLVSTVMPHVRSRDAILRRAIRLGEFLDKKRATLENGDESVAHGVKLADEFLRGLERPGRQ